MTIATDAGFLAAILAEPDDNVPRLVYADWLEEHGDEQAQTRAEFIRVQIELGQKEGQAVRPLVPSAATLAVLLDATLEFQREGLRRREKLLIPQMSEPNLVFRVCAGWSWHRGFVESITLSPREWLDHVERLLAVAPIREVTFTSEFIFDQDWGFVDSDMQIAYLMRGSAFHRDLYLDDIPEGAHIPTELLADAWPKLVFYVPHADGP